MKALRLEAWQSPAALREVDVPEPGPGQVLVQVGGAGAVSGRAVVATNEEYRP